MLYLNDYSVRIILSVISIERYVVMTVTLKMEYCLSIDGYEYFKSEMISRCIVVLSLDLNEQLIEKYVFQ